MAKCPRASNGVGVLPLTLEDGSARQFLHEPTYHQKATGQLWLGGHSSYKVLRHRAALAHVVDLTWPAGWNWPDELGSKATATQIRMVRGANSKTLGCTVRVFWVRVRAADVPLRIVWLRPPVSCRQIHKIREPGGIGSEADVGESRVKSRRRKGVFLDVEC